MALYNRDGERFVVVTLWACGALKEVGGGGGVQGRLPYGAIYQRTNHSDGLRPTKPNSFSRIRNFQRKPNPISKIAETPRYITGSGDSSLSGRSLMSPNFLFRDCFMWNPSHEENQQSLLLRACFLHHEKTLFVQTGD